MPAIGRCISFDRRNTNRDTSAAIMTTSIRGTEMTIAIMDMAITIAATTAVMTMTTTTATTSADAMPTDPAGAGPDTKAAGAAIKEGAHRVATASKAVAHEIATAAKRGAAQGRAALRGQKANPPAT
jgi:hypothetical protein